MREAGSKDRHAYDEHEHEHDVHSCEDGHEHGAHGHLYAGHSHSHFDLTTQKNQRRLILALIITGTIFVAEVIGGIVSGSLALIGDAGHMLTDTLALGLALVALRLARSAPTPTRTFGLYRAEIMA
ncbi:MAG: cation transporter, partial [Dehalococcoidia bacterium]|nr:cation transporter [Dehalococcoidia bacterium]